MPFQPTRKRPKRPPHDPTPRHPFTRLRADWDVVLDGRTRPEGAFKFMDLVDALDIENVRAKYVLKKIAQHGGKGGDSARPKQETLRRCAQCRNVKTIQRYIDEFARARVLAKERQPINGKRLNVYTLFPDLRSDATYMMSGRRHAEMSHRDTTFSAGDTTSESNDTTSCVSGERKRKRRPNPLQNAHTDEQRSKSKKRSSLGAPPPGMGRPQDAQSAREQDDQADPLRDATSSVSGSEADTEDRRIVDELRQVAPHQLIACCDPLTLFRLGFCFEPGGTLANWPDWYEGHHNGHPEAVA